MSTEYSGRTAISATTATATACGISISAASHVHVSMNDAPKMARPVRMTVITGESSGCTKRIRKPGMHMPMVSRNGLNSEIFICSPLCRGEKKGPGISDICQGLTCRLQAGGYTRLSSQAVDITGVTRTQLLPLWFESIPAGKFYVNTAPDRHRAESRKAYIFLYSYLIYLYMLI